MDYGCVLNNNLFSMAFLGIGTLLLTVMAFRKKKMAVMKILKIASPIFPHPLLFDASRKTSLTTCQSKSKQSAAITKKSV